MNTLDHLLRSMRRYLGLDRTFAILFVTFLLSGMAISAVWLAFDGRTLSEGFSRLPLSFLAMLGLTSLFFALFAPCMVISWAIGRLLGGSTDLPPSWRLGIAAAFMGAVTMLPFWLYVESRGNVLRAWDGSLQYLGSASTLLVFLFVRMLFVKG